MKFEKPIPVTEIASLINAEVVGNKTGIVTGINEIHKVEEGDLVFVDHPKYYQKAIQSKASFIIINQATDFPEHKALLLVEQPFDAYLKIVEHFRPFTPSLKQISDSAIVGKNSIIMPGAFVGNNVRIGDDCIIYPNVVIMDHCSLGNNVSIQANTVSPLTPRSTLHPAPIST